MALMKQHSGVIKKYIALLESMGFAVTEIKNGRGRHTIYILEEIGKPSNKNEEFLEILGCNIGKRNIELIKFLLKSILERKSSQCKKK